MTGAAWALAALFAVELPAVSGRVVDQAALLSAQRRAELDQKLQALEARTSVQAVVVTVPTLGGEAIESVALRLGEAWRIGQKGRDNGVIVLLARDERKLRIEVGYGLEAAIPDALASRIIRERMAPLFERGDFGGGLVAGVDALALAARWEYPPERFAQPPPRDLVAGVGAMLPGLVLVLIGWFVTFGILYDTFNVKRWWTSAVPAAVYLGILAGSVGLLTGLGAVVFPAVGLLLGLSAYPLGAVMSRASRGAGGGSSWNYSSSGSFGSSSTRSSSSSGGSPGAGFSGGGGRFGGGGATGSW